MCFRTYKYNSCVHLNRSSLILNIYFGCVLSDTNSDSFCLLKIIIVLYFDFLPRDAMQARSLLSCSVCPSVCLSATFVDHVKTNKHIFEIFHHRVATTF